MFGDAVVINVIDAILVEIEVDVAEVNKQV